MKNNSASGPATYEPDSFIKFHAKGFYLFTLPKIIRDTEDRSEGLRIGEGGWERGGRGREERGEERGRERADEQEGGEKMEGRKREG